MSLCMLVTDRIDSFNDQEISNSLLAFAKMEHVDVSLLRVCHIAFSSKKIRSHFSISV